MHFPQGGRDIQQTAGEPLYLPSQAKGRKPEAGGGGRRGRGVLLEEMKPREGKSVFPGPRDTSENGLTSL